MTGNAPTTLQRLRPSALPGWNSIRGRMAIVLAVPTCLLLALTGIGVADRAADSSAARGTEAYVGVLLRVQGLVQEVQRERGLTNGLLGGADAYRDDVREQRRRTDEARRQLRTALAEERGDLPGTTVSALDAAEVPLAALTSTRAGVDAGTAVVGALAARLGAHVELRPTQPTGVTAYAALPSRLVEQEPSLPATAAGR
jgi:hypothetical protein